MSLRPQSGVLPVPDATVRVARAAFPRGNPYLLLRERLGAVFRDGDFADLYPALGQPAYAPWRLALVTLMQFREGLIPPRLGSDPLDPAADEWKAAQSSALAASGNGSGFTLGSMRRDALC